MKIGFNVFLMKQELLTDVARKADELGVESIWISDHLIWPKEIHTEYPYSPNPYTSGAVGPHTPLLDPFVLLSHIAALTSNIRLGVGVYILPLRDPFVTARTAMTLDVLSGGRLSLGVGLGWMEEEFVPVGQGFHNRADRTEEIVQVLKALWTEDDPEFHGRFYDFGPVKFTPKPVQKPHPPLLFGGETKAALSRAARLGDGWYGLGGKTLEEASRIVKKLRELRREAGRAAEPFEITVSGAGQMTPDDIARYQEAGVDRLMMSPFSGEGGSEMDQMERFAEEILARLPS
ncbi:MAG: LLM class F420-dependent oxidoreductase [Dehalococcoidia bacterium]